MLKSPAPILTATVLRAAIRKQIASGVDKRAISFLVQMFANEELGAARDDGDTIKRQAVEHSPHGQRVAFLERLAGLSSIEQPARRRLAS
jgi:hypothetical protein